MHGPAAAPLMAFAGSPLDRADHIRVDDEALAGLMNWRARVLLLDGLLPGVDDAGGLVWGSLADVAEDAELVFLGMMDGKAHFAPVPPAGAEGPAYAQPAAWQLMQLLSPPDLAIYGGARSLVDWHARHRFCARCGSSTKPVKGGWQRHCDNCGADHFPRTDPVVIMLITHGNRVLLGRNAAWPQGMFSLLAGFIEPGETMEAAVRREVFEEAGIRVGPVRYLASQPWPFPASLMFGCAGEALDDAITIDPEEIEDARWITREEMLTVTAGVHPEIKPARKGAIAHFLIANWLADRLD